jgi:predicted RNase H-like HicB family nuclease
MQRIEHLTAIIEREDDGYVALCPELDVASQGDSVENASANLREALSLFFETASPSEVKERLHREVYVTHFDLKVGWASQAFGATGLPDFE